MTDRVPPAPDPAAGGDARDAELAAALAVPPLDEPTRRRLVRRALAEVDDAPASIARDARPQPTNRLAAALAVAAVLLVGAVVGAVVVSRPDDSTPTAARASSTAPTTAAAAAPAPESADTHPGDTEAAAPGVVSAAPPRQLGDLGAITGAAALRQVVDARLDAVAGDRAAAEAVPCVPSDPQAVGLVVVSAVGTAQLDGQPRTVLVGPTPAGSEQIVVVEQQACAVLTRIDL